MRCINNAFEILTAFSSQQPEFKCRALTSYNKVLRFLILTKEWTELKKEQGYMRASDLSKVSTCL